MTFDMTAHGLIPSPHRPLIPGAGPQTVADVLDAGVTTVPDAEALVGRYERYSYAELDREANRAAHALLQLGVRPGDRVAASMANHTDLVVAFYGAMRIGAIWFGVNRSLAPPEKAYMLRDGGALVFLGDREACSQIDELDESPPDLIHRIDAEPSDPASQWREYLAKAPDETRPDIEIDAFGPAAIAYTSGTTGFPKGAVHSQHNILMPGAMSAAFGRTEPGRRLGVCLPMTILNLMILGPVVAAQSRSCCVQMDRVDPVGLAEWIREERIVSFASVPATFHDLLTHPDVKQEDLVTLTAPGVGGANCPEEFKQLFRERFGREVLEGYGLTEAPTAVSHTNPELPRVVGSVGTALPQVSLHILDPDGSELPPGEVGEICVGPAAEGPFAGVYTPMLGYWNRSEASEQALRGGLLHTGDIGTLDVDGNLFIRDRKSDLILRGGANVYPAEVERVLYEDPRVSACAVVGVPDKRLGERVMAAVKLAREREATELELRDHCLANLARYKVPERILLVESFPLTAMGKIRKRDIKGWFENSETGDG
jgi:acyl-CoA synthetase (AMP-forming)/AMP-acid ligase II